jgi:hypothetical protein
MNRPLPDVQRERSALPRRAAEPISWTLTVDDFTKSISPHPFAIG